MPGNAWQFGAIWGNFWQKMVCLVRDWQSVKFFYGLPLVTNCHPLPPIATLFSVLATITGQPVAFLVGLVGMGAVGLVGLVELVSTGRTGQHWSALVSTGQHWSNWSNWSALVSTGRTGQHWSNWSALVELVSTGRTGQHWGRVKR